MFKPVYEKSNDNSFTFGTKVFATANTCLDNEYIKSFWNGFCCRSGEIEITPCDELIFRIGTAEALSLDGNQYAVNIEEDGLCIVADSEKGLFNGFMTVLHLIDAVKITDEETVFEIKSGVFKEKPGFKNQMIHFCVFPETELWEIEKFFRVCASLKYTHIIIEFWGMLKYDCLKELAWSHAYSKEEIRPLIKMANELGVEIIPMFNHWGHASGSRVNHGKHVVLDQNPSLQPLFSDDGWTWAFEKEDVQNLLRNIRNELIELCGSGDYFHLGCDEAYNFEITTENYNILTDYLNKIADELSSMSRKAIVWGDMLIANRDSYNQNNRYTVNCESVETEKKILANLSKDIIIADWQYCVKEAPVETALVFKEAGFNTILCPWDYVTNWDSVSACITTAKNESLLGVMHTTWNTLSLGMRDVAKVAYLMWKNDDSAVPTTAFYATHMAKLMRKTNFVNGDYVKAGWSKKQIDDNVLR